MKRTIGTVWLGWIVAIAMVLIGVASPASLAAAHPAVEHSVALDDHGHSHDFGDVEYEPSGAHKHAHAGDHTHDVPGLPPVVDAGIRATMLEDVPIPHQGVPDNLPAAFDRPPKTSVLV